MKAKRKTKKSFSLLITIVLVSLFSYLALSILQTKSFSNKNLENQYLYIQAKNHKEFFKEYINSLSLDELKNIQSLEIEDKNYEIKAFITKEDKTKIEIFIKSKTHNISIYENFFR